MLRLTPFNFSYQPLDRAVSKLFSKQEIVLSKSALYLVTGASGVGKSTLLSLIKGLTPHFIPAYFQGEIYYKNQLIDSSSVHRRKNEIVYLFQNPFQQIIYQNSRLELAFTAESQEVSYSDFLNNIDKLNEIFALQTIVSKKTHELSLGQAQRLLLASLLASGPEVLLLDEPTAFLDKQARSNFYKLVFNLRNDYLIIMVDHHLDDVKKYCDGFLQVSDSGEVRLLKAAPESVPGRTSVATVEPQIAVSHKVKMQNVSFSFDPQTVILDQINFAAQSPQIVALTGVNGAGKSTFLKILSGYLKPSSGRVFCPDEIGFVMQNPEDNFMFDTAAEELEGVDPLLKKKFFKDKDLDVSPYSLSEGEKRRLSLLLHLNRNKKVILYDEPTFGLDENNKKLVVESLLDIKSNNILQIVVSHDDNFISQVADQIYQLQDGKLLKRNL